MSTPSIITWKRGLSVGVADVDEDHKKLIKMVNKLFGAVLSSDPTRVLERVLAELSDYVVIHFEREEALMQRLNYPEYAAHKAEHQNLLDAATRFKKNLASGLATHLKEEIETLLRDWLVTHIMSQDKRLGRFLNENGIH